MSALKWLKVKTNQIQDVNASLYYQNHRGMINLVIPEAFCVCNSGGKGLLLLIEMLQYISGKHKVSKTKSEMRKSIKMCHFKLSVLSLAEYKDTYKLEPEKTLSATLFSLEHIFFL